MDKILLAVGHIGLEEYIKKELSEEFEFVGESVHRENILNLIKETSPNILVIRETLPGKTKIINLVYTIRANFENIRIVFLAGERSVGDELLSNLVNYGIYDILHSGNLLADDIINLVKVPNTYQDVKHLQPLPDLEEFPSNLEFIMPEDEEDEEETEQEDKGNIEFVMPDESTLEKIKKEKNKRIKKEINEGETEEEIEQRKRIKIPKISIPKISLPNFEFEKKEKKEKKNKEKEANVKTKAEKIITFWGSKNGVGNTTVAHNMAFSLANDGNKVIYIELDDIKPSVSYWYDLGHLSEGIETFLKYLNKKEYKNIESSIIKTTDIKIEKKYKKFPDGLDFLFFSKEYLTGFKSKEYEGSLKDLYMYLLYQGGYDFVIIDVANNVELKDLKEILMFSSKVFILISQDVSSIGYHTLDIDNLIKAGINIRDKSHYIINKYIDSSLNTNKIKEWLEVDKITSIPNNREVYINASLNSVPVIMDKSNGVVLRNRLEELKKTI